MERSNWHKRTKKKGAIYMFIVFILTVTTVALAVGFTNPNLREYRNANRDNLSNNALLLAEAGNEDALYRLKQGMNISSPAYMSLNDAYATTTVSIIGSTVREITTISAIKQHTRKTQLRVDNTTTQAEFLYGAQIGSWGVEMANNTDVTGILPAVGDIYSNGSIRGSGGGVTVTGNIHVSTGIVEDDAQSLTCSEDQIVGQTNPEVDFAQSFIASSTADIIHGVQLYLRKNNNPSSLTVYLVADNGGVPDTTVLASGVLDRNKVTSVYSWIDVVFDSPTTLTGGNTYWIVFDALRHNSKYWLWCKDAGNPYPGGSAAYTQDWTSPSYVAVLGDLTFRVFYGEGESIISGVDDLQGDGHADYIQNSTILGDAYYQTITGSTVIGSSFSGSPTPPQIPQPISDSVIANWIAGAEAGGTITGNCPDEPACASTMGPVKIDGDLTIDSDNLVVTGTIYVTGNINSNNNSSISCHPTYGATSCIVIADGFMDFRNNTSFEGTADPKSFILLISLKEGCLITTGVGCGPGNSAIYHNNNASTGGIFFAQESVAYLENLATVSSVVSKGVKLDPNSGVIYNVDLRDIELASGLDGGWVVEYWREIE